ncbi:YeiH family putative sulfate export transporter [Affinibrenneria salicis]|uniref:YeiH family putative sulfate export transporter n=1 Tax=Affinibrenneria salicis TaxID=2590031 RepID=A0A5J5FR50_9GAMM|nr:YeiH family protein [Affinibrenneria salicis]KAA8995268.1 YeiH family putative sulfate export transporter [Affinibrenneria salicis]
MSESIPALRPQGAGRLRYPQITPGLIFTGCISLCAIEAGKMPGVAAWGAGTLTLAIVAGIIIGNTLYPWLHSRCDPGVQWAKQYLLRLGIILYGFQISFQEIMDIGLSGLIIGLLTLTSTLLLAGLLGRKVFKLDRQTWLLIGAGSSICGAAAVLATAPVVKASSDKIAVAVSTVVIFGTAAMFLYPAIYRLDLYYSGSFFNPQTFGVYLGSTTHEVAQVVAAGHAIGPLTESTAVIAKMLRVMMLAPFLLILSFCLRKDRRIDDDRQPRRFAVVPWFALLFIAATALNSWHLLPREAVHELNLLDTWLLAMAMCAMGLTTRLSAIHHAGARPLLLGLLLFIWLIAGGGAINLAVQYGLS